MIRRLPLGVTAFLASLIALSAAGLAAPAGEQMFLEKCAICHQANGQGAPPMYPPLAKSDFLRERRRDAVKAVCEGFSGAIVVNGAKFNNTMPAQMLDDEQVAVVLNYVLTSFGNEGKKFSAEEVREVRKTTKFPTFAQLQASSAYAPLPKAPAGWTLREVAQLPEFCTRLAEGPEGRYYVLAQQGSIYTLDVAGAALSMMIRGEDYISADRGSYTTSGLTVGPEGNLWIVSNQQIKESVPYRNEVVIYRTSKMAGKLPQKPVPWLKTHYPYGVSSYNHGVSHLAFGPDGMLYVSSGSRTDGGEASQNPNFSSEGEVDLTAAMWRIDPKAEKPKIEVIAHGIRNAYGFAWDGQKQLFTVANGPDANEPEEMDLIEPGKHYGFPYQFGKTPAKAGSPYPYTPAAPPGLKFTYPVVNFGPHGGGTRQGMYTFDPHSSPAGIIWCGDDYPDPVKNRFVMTRFGNLLGPPAAPVDVGFDVLTLRMGQGSRGSWATNCTTLLAPLGRPLDVVHGPDHSILILEYTRPTNFIEKLGWLPGRVLQLSPQKQTGAE